jgi:hypothetical protein
VVDVPVEIDRRGPGAFADRCETVVVLGGLPIAVAGVDVDGVALIVESRAELGAVDRGCRRLEGAHVVDGIVVALRELGIVELDRAAGGIRRTCEAPPGILDPRCDRLPGFGLGADPDHLDRDDRMAGVARVVALAEAERLQSVRAELVAKRLRTAGLLSVGAGGAYAKARRVGEPDLTAHRRRAARSVQQIEPQQDARPAGAVDLATGECLPQRVAAASRGVHRHQAARIHEAGVALSVEQRREAAGLVIHAARETRVAGLLREGPLDPVGGLGIAQSARIGGGQTIELFEARRRARAVVVARRDEPPAVSRRR